LASLKSHSSWKHLYKAPANGICLNEGQLSVSRHKGVIDRIKVKVLEVAIELVTVSCLLKYSTD
jgi:hypothetical protein